MCRVAARVRAQVRTRARCLRGVRGSVAAVNHDPAPLGFRRVGAREGGCDLRRGGSEHEPYQRARAVAVGAQSVPGAGEQGQQYGRRTGDLAVDQGRGRGGGLSEGARRGGAVPVRSGQRMDGQVGSALVIGRRGRCCASGGACTGADASDGTYGEVAYASRCGGRGRGPALNSSVPWAS